MTKDLKMTTPAAVAEARRRGWPISSGSIKDAAALAGLPLYVPASNSVGSQLLEELGRAERNERARQADTAWRKSSDFDAFVAKKNARGEST